MSSTILRRVEFQLYEQVSRPTDDGKSWIRTNEWVKYQGWFHGFSINSEAELSPNAVAIVESMEGMVYTTQADKIRFLNPYGKEVL